VPPDPDSPSNAARVATRPGPQDPSAGSAESDSHFSAAVTAVTSAFGDPTRREIYLFVRSNPGANASIRTWPATTSTAWPPVATSR
jgi:hypothetical protein